LGHVVCADKFTSSVQLLFARVADGETFAKGLSSTSVGLEVQMNDNANIHMPLEDM